MPRVAIVDYGVGNLRSVERALARAGADAVITPDPGVVAGRDGVVLPGVGAFAPAAALLLGSGLGDAVREAAGRGRPSSASASASSSSSRPARRGEGGRGSRPASRDGCAASTPPRRSRCPTWGGTGSGCAGPSALTAGVEEGAWCYFVHSYAADADPRDVVATVDYGGEIVAICERGTVTGTQFHPEKSGPAGLRIYANLVAASPARRTPAQTVASVIVIPAIDIRGGRCVRLIQGDFAREHVYENDPAAVARRLVESGAHRIHLVDLDAARGMIDLASTTRRPARPRERSEAGVEVEVGGGVRTLAAAERWLAAGAAFVVLGSVAVREPEAAAGDLRGPARALPGRPRRARRHRPRPRAGPRARAAPPPTWSDGRPGRSAGLVRTDVALDGMLSGPDLAGLEETVRAFPGTGDRERRDQHRRRHRPLRRGRRRRRHRGPGPLRGQLRPARRDLSVSHR